MCAPRTGGGSNTAGPSGTTQNNSNSASNPERRQFSVVNKEFKYAFNKKFEPMTTNKTIRAREFVRYIKNFEYVLDTLEIKEPEYKARLLSLHELDLVRNAKALVGDDNEQVVAATDAYKKLKKKLFIYLECLILEEPARQKLAHIKQKHNQSAADLLIEIRELHEESGYSEADKIQFVRSTFLRAIRSEKVREFWDYSKMPGKVPLTTDQLVNVANAVELGEQRKDKTYTGGQVVQAVKFFNKPKRFQKQKPRYSPKQQKPKKCAGCGAIDKHQYLSDQCPAKNAKCSCGRIGHFTSECISGKFKNFQNKNKYQGNFQNKNKYQGKFQNKNKKKFYKANKVEELDPELLQEIRDLDFGI